MKAIIIGGGFIARTHIEAIRSLGHEVVCVAGRDAAKTEAFASENGIPHYTTDIDEALACDAGMVHICTPPALHFEIARKCFEAEKNVICEKPLCIDPAEAAALVEEAKRAYKEKWLVSALCLNVRYYPANLEAARLLQQGTVSEAKIFTGSYLQEFHIPPHPDGWRFDDKKSGGQRAISEIGTHWIDLAYAWTGLHITEVYASLGNWYPSRYRKDGMLTLDPDGEEVITSTEDTAAVTLTFENGAIGTLLLSETSPGHPNDLSIEVTDLKTSYKWDETSPNKLYFSENGGMTSVEFPACDRPDTFPALFREVYAAAEGKAHGSYPTFEDGLYIAKVCAAIRKSGETCLPVKIDL